MNTASIWKVGVLIALTIALWWLNSGIHRPHGGSQPFASTQTSKENQPMPRSDNRPPQVLRVPQDYAQIQAAIDTAPEGSIILIGPGTYGERLIINKSLTLLGAGAEQTIIDGSAVAPAFQERVTLSVTLQIGGPKLKPGGRPIEVQIGNLAIIASQDLPFSGDALVNLNAAVGINAPAYVTVWNCRISGATGIQIVSSTQLTSWQNQISSSLTGIQVVSQLGPSSLFLEGDIIRIVPLGPQRGTGMSLANAQAILNSEKIEGAGVAILITEAQVSIRQSTIQNNGNGIAIGGNSSLDMSLSQVTNNQTYGVALIQPPCYPNILLPEPGPGGQPPPAPSIQILGGGNTISGNQKADLCPTYPGSPWPPSFVK